MTEAVFAFLLDSWDRTNSPFLNRELRYHYAISTYCDVLPQLLNNLLDCRIQHTTYLLPRELLSDVLRPVSLSHDKTTNH
jgi:hypothetical protein